MPQRPTFWSETHARSSRGRSGRDLRRASARPHPESVSHQIAKPIGTDMRDWSATPDGSALSGTAADHLCEIDPIIESGGALDALAVAVGEIGDEVARKQGELHELFHDVDDSIVIR